MCLSEHPFGTIKRAMGAAYFLPKGIRKVVGGEFALFCLGYNPERAKTCLDFIKWWDWWSRRKPLSSILCILFGFQCHRWKKGAEFLSEIKDFRRPEGEGFCAEKLKMPTWIVALSGPKAVNSNAMAAGFYILKKFVVVKPEELIYNKDMNGSGFGLPKPLQWILKFQTGKRYRRKRRWKQ